MHAVICGAGIAGLALAQRLQSSGWRVTVVEQAAGPRQQGYMIDFFGLGYDAAEHLGVLRRLHELGYAVDELAYVDARGRRRAGADYRRFADALDGRLLSILRGDLERALREQVSGHVDLRFATTVTAFEERAGGVRVSLSDGDTIEADLLVGADGIHSRVRDLAFGDEERFLRPLGLHTAAFLFDDPAVRDAAGDRFALTDTVDRMMGFYALRDGRVAAFAVHRSSDPRRPDDVPGTLRRVYGSLGWMAPAALASLPPADDVYYDVVAQVEVPSWHRGHVVLVGDACQAVSLLAGQGASLAVAGAYVLGEQLAATTSVPQALARYQQGWQPVVVDKQRAGRAGVEWFLPSSRARLWARRLALAATAVPALGRRLSTGLVGKTRVSMADLSADDRSLVGAGRAPE